MNKYEKLIEYIVNDEQDKARALFHDIVVEKSRGIYESMMDDEQQGQHPGGDQVGGMMDEIGADEHGMHEEEDEMDMDGAEEFGTDDDMGGEMGDDMGGEGDIEDRVMDLETALDELKAEFEQLMSDEHGEEHDDMGGMDDMGSEMDMGDEEPADESMMYEAKDEDEEEEEEEEEEEMSESRRAKSEAERLREYVDKVSDGHGAEKGGSAEGHEVGKGGSVSVNKSHIVAGKNDMGGTAANIVKGGSEQAPDGTSQIGRAHV